MLQAFLVVPGLAAAYLWAAPTTLWRRIRQLLAAGVAIVVSAGWWLLAVALWPADSRPYIGGSTNNSPLELAFGYNGLGRIFGGEGNGGARRGAEMAGGFPGGAGCRRDAGAARWRRYGRLRRPGRAHPAVQQRDRRPDLLAAARGPDPAGRRAPASPAARRGQTRCAPRSSCGAAGRLVTALVFSLMEGTFHAYYTVALAPGSPRWWPSEAAKPGGPAAPGPVAASSPGPPRSPPSGPGCCSVARRRSCPGCAGSCSRSASSP